MGIVRSMDGPADRPLVVLTGASGSLGHRVADLLAGYEVVLADSLDEIDSGAVVPDGCVRATTVVDLGSSDYDTRAARRESATESAATTLEIADRVARIPRAVRVVGTRLRRGGEQSGSADRGRHSAAGRRVRVRTSAGIGRGARRTVAIQRARQDHMCAATGGGTGSRGRITSGNCAGVRVRPPPRAGRSTVAVSPPRRPGCSSARWCRPSPRRCLQCRTGRMGAGRASPRARRESGRGCRCPTGSASWWPACAGDSSEVRFRPDCCRTRSSPG